MQTLFYYKNKIQGLVLLCIVVTQFKNLNCSSRYRHESAPNVTVLAARLGTKEWGW
jgi:hypothetical protein